METPTPHPISQNQNISYVLTLSEAQKIKYLVFKEIKKCQEKIIQLELENKILKEKLSQSPEPAQTTMEKNPLVG